MTILEKIDQLRNERGWSINYLAMESMLTQSTLNNLYTRGNEPKISTLKAICDAFGISLSEFFAEEPKNTEVQLDEQLIKSIKKLSLAQKKSLLGFLQTI